MRVFNISPVWWRYPKGLKALKMKSSMIFNQIIPVEV